MGAQTKAAGNTSAQEAYISSLKTGGALDSGSGFSRSFGKGETNEQYAARLEAWKNSKKTPTASTPTASAPAAAPRPAAGLTPSPAPEAPLAGLTAIDVGVGGQQTPQTGAVTGMGGMMEAEPVPMTGVASGAVGQLRNLGRRTPPIESYALAGLRKIY